MIKFDVEIATPDDATPSDAWSDMLNFESGDTGTYTVTAEADSSAGQAVMYLVDIRNILLIFLLLWIIISLYYRLKNTINSFFK